MRRALPLLFALLAGCGAFVAPPPADPAPGEIALRPVTVAELNAAVASHKGKVVVIDCWFRGCAPCVKKFPHMMELRRELEVDGLVLITLDVYQPEFKQKEKVLEFLREQNSTGPNYIFKDTGDAVDKWLYQNNAESVPALVVYGRDGAKVEVPEVEGKDAVRWAAEEKFLRELVAKK